MQAQIEKFAFPAIQSRFRSLGGRHGVWNGREVNDGRDRNRIHSGPVSTGFVARVLTPDGQRANSAHAAPTDVNRAPKSSVLRQAAIPRLERRRKVIRRRSREQHSLQNHELFQFDPFPQRQDLIGPAIRK